MELNNNYYFKDDISFALLTFSDDKFEIAIDFQMNSKTFTHLKITREIGIKYTDYKMFYEQRNTSNVVISSVAAYSVLVDNSTNTLLASDWQKSTSHTKEEMQSLTFSKEQITDTFFQWFSSNTIPTHEMVQKKLENLLDKINKKTKRSDRTLTQAVNFLLSKYCD